MRKREPIKTIVERPGEAAEISVPYPKKEVDQTEAAEVRKAQREFEREPYVNQIPIGREKCNEHR